MNKNVKISGGRKIVVPDIPSFLSVPCESCTSTGQIPIEFLSMDDLTIIANEWSRGLISRGYGKLSSEKQGG